MKKTVSILLLFFLFSQNLFAVSWNAKFVNHDNEEKNYFLTKDALRITVPKSKWACLISEEKIAESKFYLRQIACDVTGTKIRVSVPIVCSSTLDNQQSILDFRDGNGNIYKIILTCKM